MSKVFRKAYLRYIEHRIGRMIGFDPPMIIGGKSFPVTLKRLIDEGKQRVISRKKDIIKLLKKEDWQKRRT